MLYNQPLATRFGTELLQQVDPSVEPFWDTLDIAVAWVRASGMAYLSHRFIEFLRHGGQLSVIVGIDLKNTTREGLQALLDLEQHGHCETFVYHNEAGSIFHPKLYLFRNVREARLIVGSNNLTESGLYVNVEAGLQVDTKIGAGVVRQALDALSTWKDPTSRLAFRLDTAFLDRLSNEGYVTDEAAARAQMRQEKGRRSGRTTPPLFATRRFVPPPIERPAPQRLHAPKVTPRTRTTPRTQQTTSTMPPVLVAASPGTTLLMRLRMARGTQTQIPIRLTETFFANARQVRSTQTGETHGISLAKAGGRRNTMKLEMPEIRDFDQPMARFEQTQDGIIYEVYDLGSPQGNQIMAALTDGRRDNTTQMSIRNVETATWWRFI